MTVTVDATTGGTGALSQSLGTGMYRLYKTFDLAALKASLNDDTDFTTGDIMKAFSIPANTLVLTAHCKVHVAEGATCTIDLGITGGDTDGFLDGADLNSTSTSIATGHTLGYGTDNMLGKLVTTADTVDILFVNSGSGAAVFTLSLLCVDLAVHDYVA
jgi:hypothetical protein